jgi:hypothetical protein
VGARTEATARSRAPRRADGAVRAATRALPRSLRERPALAAAGLLALFVLAYLWPALVGGKMLSPLSSLYAYPPWRGLEPRDLADYSNPLLADVPTADYPWRFLARELIREGTFPAWNPHVFAGIPFFANPQTMILSPFSLPLWLLPLHYAVGLSAALMLWSAAFGTYLLVRELGLRFLPGLLAGVAFALCSFHVVWLTHGSLPAVSALLPWMLWLIERVLRRGAPAAAIGLAVATAIALTGGHPGAQAHVLAASALYVLLRAASAGGGEGVPAAARRRRAALAGGGIAFGALLAAVMFLPELLSAHGTLGTQARQGGGELPGTQMPFGALASVALPDWWGRPSAIQIAGPIFHPQPGIAQEVTFNERTFYAGVVALLLALIALASRGRWRAKLPFAVLGAVALAIPLHAPGLYWLAEHLPGLELVQNQRMHVVFELATAVLAAFGLDALLAAERPRRRVLLAPLLGVAAALVAVAVLAPGGEDLWQVGHHFWTGADVATQTALSLTSVAWLLLLSCGVAAALLALRRWPRRGTLVAALLVLLAAFDMLRFAHGYQPMGDPAKVVPPETPAIRFLARHAGEGRVVGLNVTFPNDWTLVYGLRDVRGYDPPYPSLRLYRLWRAANPSQGDWEPFRVTGLQLESHQLLNVLGARWVVTEPGTRIDPRAADTRGIHAVYGGGDATIFANERAAPRALVARRVQLVEDADGMVLALMAGGFDARRTAVVERSQPGAEALASGAPAAGTARVVEDRNARVTLATRLERRGLVVLNDALFDGWSVEVDGRPAPVVRVDELMRGVVVPAGAHEVTWRYAVPGLRLGALVSLLAALALLGAGAWLRLRARPSV